MEENSILEQPENLSGAGNVSEQISKGEEVQPNLESSSSSFGKFKDPASLLSAYNNLEKEFTKKSQKLAEIMKNQTTNENQKSIYQSQTDVQNNNNSDFQEQFKSDNWKTYASDFINNNPEAKKFSKEIFEIIKEDRNLASSPKCLEYAFAICKQRNQVDTESLLSDQKFLNEHILSNQKIKDIFIKEYISSIKNGKELPKVISGTTQDINVTIPENKPKTIKDASNILKKLLNS